MSKVSEKCQENKRDCTAQELIQLGREEAGGLIKEVGREVESTLFDRIEFAIAIVIGLQISSLFEIYIIPLIPVSGFWGYLLTISIFIGLLALFIVFKNICRRLTKGK